MSVYLRSKIGLKLWNINDHYLNPAKALYKEGVYQYIELYIVPGHVDKIEQWKKLGIPIHIHAPHFQHGMNLSKRENFEKNNTFYQEVKFYADELSSEFIIFHSGTDGDYKETARQLNIFNDKRTVIENKPYKTLPFIKGEFYVGGKVDEIQYIINETGCRFCLDIGHAISAANGLGIEPYDHISQFMNLEPYMYHLSDIDVNSDMDMHLNYGQGNLEFERLFRLIPREMIISIETNKCSKENLDDFKKDAERLKEYLR